MRFCVLYPTLLAFAYRYTSIIRSVYEDLFVDRDADIYNVTIRNLLLEVDDPREDSPTVSGPCFRNVTCRYATVV